MRFNCVKRTCNCMYVSCRQNAMCWLCVELAGIHLSLPNAHVGETPCRRNAHAMKRRVGETPMSAKRRRRNAHVGEKPCRRNAHVGETPCRRKAVSAKRRVGEAPCRRNALSAKRRVGEKAAAKRRVGETSSYPVNLAPPICT